MTERVHVIVTAPTGSGKSAIYGEIVLAMQAIGVTVEHADPASWQSECHMTYADWQSALDLYQPTVVMEERNLSRLAAQKADEPQGGEERARALAIIAKSWADRGFPNTAEQIAEQDVWVVDAMLAFAASSRDGGVGERS